MGTKLAAPAPPPSLDDDEDDDLPRPGKVWTGPSLAELARAQVTPAAPPRENAGSLSNVEAVDPGNLPAVWQAMLKLLAAQSPMVHPLLSPGKLVGVVEGQAIIRYSPQHDTFVKMLERNGKKDLVRDKLSEVMGKPVGVRFEVDPNFTPDAAPQATLPAPSRPAAGPVAEEPPSPPSVKVTPELVETLRNEPLVRALMDNLGATIVKVE
jgi:hypothetical protein